MEESISEIISIKRKNIDNIEAEIKELERLEKKYTDLQIHIDETGVKRFVSKKANPIVKECFLTHTINYYGDGLLIVVWCWLQDKKSWVYSNPAHIHIGEADMFSYKLKRTFKGWKKYMKSNNFPTSIIEEISKRLKYFRKI